MTDPIAFLPFAAPLALCGVALSATVERGPFPRRVPRVAALAGAAALAVAALTAVLVAVRGPLVAGLPGLPGLGPLLRVDPLAATLLLLVAFLGAVVLRYSRHYLDGDARHGAFVGFLALTIASVMLLVLAAHLAVLVAAWVLTSVVLHRLLLFYPDRPRARVVARKKFLVARLGDAALAGAALLLARAFGTWDLALLGERAAALAATGEVPPSVHAAAALLVLTAALKSAQFPTWGWLIEVMETPTPVSALLHAGILNGGAFLVARMADVMVLSPPAMHALVITGATTALLASLARTAQTTVKGALAYSSAAHMGFTLLLCGLGEFPLAILHLVAHSCYKAHAFLSAGSAVEGARALSSAMRPVPGARAIAASLATALAMAVVTATAFGALTPARPASLGLVALLAMSLVPLLAHGFADRGGAAVVRRVAAAAAGVSAAFFALKWAAGALFAPSFPAPAAGDAVTTVLLALVVLAFAAAVLLQLLLPRASGSRRWGALYVHVRNGFHANALFDRLVDALRVAPRRPSAPEIAR